MHKSLEQWEVRHGARIQVGRLLKFFANFDHGGQNDELEVIGSGKEGRMQSCCETKFTWLLLLGMMGRRHSDSYVENNVGDEKSYGVGVADLELLVGEEAGLLLLLSLSLADGENLGELKSSLKVESTRRKMRQSHPTALSGELNR
ncbi:hypothetical protein FF1_040563 [Malus domestica]